MLFFPSPGLGRATNVSIVTLLIPVTSVLLGSAILCERVSTDQIAGMLLIASGLITIDGRALDWAFRVVARDRNPHARPEEKQPGITFENDESTSELTESYQPTEFLTFASVVGRLVSL
ncbi:MAG: EamA family transporter [Acetobacteraceae bacterium]